MSAIFPPPLPGGLAAATPGFDPAARGATLGTALGATFGAGGDAIAPDPWRAPQPAPVAAPPIEFGYANPQTNADDAQFMAIVSQLLGAVSSILTRLGTFLGGAQASKDPGVGAQAHFANATASSTGDPHEAFHATTGTGRAVDGAWDSMTSHGDLLSSDSFEGGYRIASVATQPNERGVTMNARVSVATDAGDTSVAMNADGSYDVASHGHDIALQTGIATHVAAGETVTKNADGSLTIDDRNARGGSIATTLRGNGAGGVDVTSRATDIDLGGYLVTRRDSDPVAVAESFASEK